MKRTLALLLLGFAACGNPATGDVGGGGNDIILQRDDFTEYYTNDEDGDDGKTFRFATYQFEYPDGTTCYLAAHASGDVSEKAALAMVCFQAPPG